MKTIIFLFFIFNSILNANISSHSISFFKEFLNNTQSTTNKEVEEKSYQQLPSSLFVKKFINDKKCDQILNNQGFFTTCYDYDLKSPIFIHSKVKGGKVDLSIKERPQFYSDNNIPLKYRTHTKDYTRSGFDRGHFGASDASFDFSQRGQLSTYVMSNIVPQYPNTNRKSYLSLEEHERKLAKQYGEIDVISFAMFDKNPKRIGQSKLAVPTATGKIFFNDKHRVQGCFLVKNDNKVYKNSKVECRELINKLLK